MCRSLFSSRLVISIRKLPRVLFKRRGDQAYVPLIMWLLAIPVPNTRKTNPLANRPKDSKTFAFQLLQPLHVFILITTE